MDARQLRLASFRLFLVWVLLSTAAKVWGSWLIKAISPWLAYIIERAVPGFDAQLHLMALDSGAVLQLRAFAQGPIHLTGSFGLPPGATITTATHVGHAMIPPVLMLSLLAAWPLHAFTQYGRLLLVGGVAAFGLISLTTPLLLVGKLEMFFTELAERRGLTYDPSLFVDWSIFMEMGGRWLLPIVAAGGIILGLQLVRRLRELSR